MKFESTGKFENPNSDDSDNFYGKFNEKTEEFEVGLNEKLDELHQKSDFVIVTVKGKEYFTSNVNYCGGVCDDCTEFHNYEISKAEGFKKV